MPAAGAGRPASPGAGPCVGAFPGAGCPAGRFASSGAVRAWGAFPGAGCSAGRFASLGAARTRVPSPGAARTLGAGRAATVGSGAGARTARRPRRPASRGRKTLANGPFLCRIFVSACGPANGSPPLEPCRPGVRRFPSPPSATTRTAGSVFADALRGAWDAEGRGGAPVSRRHRGRAGRMRACGAPSEVPPGAGTWPAAPPGAKVTPGTYNLRGGVRVQLAWQRYSTCPPGSSSRGRPRRRPAAPFCARPARRSDRACPACPARPAACR